MEPRSQKATDMISNLPKEVREMILAYLPTKEAGRTSILSTDWRQAWTSIPDLVLHYDDNVEPATAIKWVDQFLALHDGPVRKFDLRIMVDQKINCSDDLDRWFNHLSRNGIKELSLQFKILNDDDDFYIRAPKINAPNLKKLYISRWLHFIELYAPELIFLCLNMSTDKWDLERFYGPLPAIDLNKFFRGIPNLEILELRDEFIDNLIGAELDAGKFLLKNLKELWLDMEYLKEERFEFIRPLFLNAPNLQVLHLRIYWFSVDQGFWESMKGRDFPFESVEVINLYGILCCIQLKALPFLEFLLGSASKLRKLIIKKMKDDCDEKQEMCLKKKLMSIKISTKARIIFEEN